MLIYPSITPDSSSQFARYYVNLDSRTSINTALALLLSVPMQQPLTPTLPPFVRCF